MNHFSKHACPLSQSFVSEYLFGIHQIYSFRSSTLRLWLLKKNYTIYNKTEKTSGEIYISQGNLPEFKQSWNDETYVFSIASLESIIEATRWIDIDKSSVAWAAIKAYYAAFYAAHATLRLMGRSLVNIEKAHIASISCIENLFTGSPSTLEEGFYIWKTNSIDQTLHMNLSFHKLPKHSHEATWKAFLDLLRDLETVTSNAGHVSSALKQETIRSFHAIAESISDFGRLEGGNWLSQKRNEINYRPESCIWRGIGRASREACDKVRPEITKWQYSPRDIPLPTQDIHPVLRLFQTSSAIVGLLLDLCSHLYNIDKRGFLASNMYKAYRDALVLVRQ